MALFALRQMPHRDSGFSPLDLAYGFQVRGHLDLVYLGWLEETCEGVPVTKWVDSLQRRISELTDLSVARRKKGNDRHREKLNSGRSDRALKEEELVLMKVPGRSGAFQSSWEGPFKVKESEVGNIRKVSNSLGEESCMGYNEGQLQEVLSEFSDTFKDTPGCCLTTDCNIELEWDAVPVNLPVRRVPFNIRGGVKDALTRMVDDGVIEPVRDSRWCSPIVPVRKPDGSIRVCVDYRAVNEVTPLVRHYMPTLDELLERAGGLWCPVDPGPNNRVPPGENG